MELADCLVPQDQDLDYGDVVFGSGLRHVPGRVAMLSCTKADLMFELKLKGRRKKGSNIAN